jgi:hypothetical protein
MADRPPYTPEASPEGGEIIIDETSDEYFEPVLSSENNDLINETIAYLGRTVSAKALEASLLIGGYILTNYFNDDFKAAFSKDPNWEYQYHELGTITPAPMAEDLDRVFEELTYEIDVLIGKK